ncbi:unnamed protein product [Aphanomyces euteiches]
MAKKTWSMRRTSRNDDGQHMLTVGSHVIRDAAKDTCGSLVRTFPLNSAIDTLAGTVRLDVVFDSLQYVRGSIFEHMSGTADTRPAPPDATHDVLTDFGYKPTRMDCDMSLTTPIQVPNASGVVVSTNTSMFRFYAKSFCTACPPIVEFGHDICALNVTYNATAQTTTVLSSKARIGGVHMPHPLDRWLCARPVLTAIFGYIASQKTIRWCDATALSTWYKRAIYTMSPPIYRYSSYAFSFSSFCLNSDWFVFGDVIAVFFDEKHSIQQDYVHMERA